jgi:hypothetical protein
MSVRLILLSGLLAMTLPACSRGQERILAPPPFEILTDDSGTPWHASQNPYEVKVSTRWNRERTLIRISSGNWTRVLYHLDYRIDRILEDRMEEGKLTFFAERPFPIPGSGILLKERWPFATEIPLVLTLRRGSGRWVIVSVEG